MFCDKINNIVCSFPEKEFDILNDDMNRINLTKRQHDMGKSFGDESSCKSNTSLTYSTLNVLALKGQ